ncbi:DsbA family protein [soil metagenome]
MTPMKTLAALGLALVALTLNACGGGSGAAEGDMAMGAADGAKVTVVEYASPTCPHCALWQKNTWPAFKAKYIDTNKIRYIFRELPTPPVDIAAAGVLLARCAGPDKYFDVMHELLASQDEWRSGAVTPRASLIKTAGSFGIDEAKFQACVTDEKATAALDKRIQGAIADGITGTPTFVVNGKQVAYTGGEGPRMPLLDAAIDPELAK